MDKKYVASGGIGFTGLLTILFVAFKLLGIIDWPWIWVLSPIWISIALSLLIFIIVFILIIFTVTD